MTNVGEKVYLVIDGVDYEGFEIRSVHKTEEGAVKKATKMTRKWKNVTPLHWRNHDSYVEIQAVEVEE